VTYYKVASRHLPGKAWGELRKSVQSELRLEAGTSPFACSVLLAALCLAAGSPIPDAENLHISFAEITTTPTPSEKDLLKQHEDLTPVCLTMLPAHGDAQPQNSSAPYKVTLNKTKTAPGDVVSGRYQEDTCTSSRTGSSWTSPGPYCTIYELISQWPVVSFRVRNKFVAVLVTGVGNQLFRGLFMQARTEQGEPVGQFLPSDDEHVRLTSCGKGRNVSSIAALSLLDHGDWW